MSGDTCTSLCGNTPLTPTQNSNMWQPEPHISRRESVVVR